METIHNVHKSYSCPLPAEYSPQLQSNFNEPLSMCVFPRDQMLPLVQTSQR